MEKLRKNFSQIRQLARQNNANLITTQMIKAQYNSVVAQTNKAQTTNQFQNLDQLVFYRQKYTEMSKLISESQKDKISKSQFIKQTNKLFDQLSPQEKVSGIQRKPQIKITDSKIVQKKMIQSQLPKSPQIKNLPNQNQPKSQINKTVNTQNLMSFFQQKELEAASQVSFKQVLDHPPIATRSFKKKPAQSKIIDNQLKNLQQQNRVLEAQIRQKQMEKSKLQKNGQYQKIKALQRIKELQQQIQYLSKDNQRLRTVQRSLRSHSPLLIKQQDLQDAQENIYAPYIINPQKNDLRKLIDKNITVRNQEIYKNQHQNLNGELQLPRNSIIHEHLPSSRRIERVQSHYKNLSEKKSSLSDSNASVNRGDYFDSFSIANSRLVSPLNSRQRVLGVRDSYTATRNKVSFFKDSLIIVRDDDFDIAFKKSQLNETLDQLRIVFYINNKTYERQSVNIQYRDQSRNYQIIIKEKLRLIQPQTQGRQVLHIKLVNSRQISSVIDGNFNIGFKSYQLWIPANFIIFGYSFVKESSNTQLLTINPDKQFSNYQNAEAILPLANKQYLTYDTIGFLYGKSKCHNGTIKLTWKNNDKQIIIEGSPKWIDFIGFILCKYRQ